MEPNTSKIEKNEQDLSCDEKNKLNNKTLGISSKTQSYTKEDVQNLKITFTNTAKSTIFESISTENGNPSKGSIFQNENTNNSFSKNKNSSSFKIPKASISNVVIEQKTLLDYEDGLNQLEPTYDSGNQMNPRIDDRNFLRIFKRPCFGYFRNNKVCKKQSCEFSHGTYNISEVKNELSKLPYEDLKKVFECVCTFPDLLFGYVSPFIEILVENKNVKGLQDQWKIINQTQLNSVCFIPPYKKAFENSSWPPTSVLRRMYMAIRSLPYIQLPILNFFFNIFMKSSDFVISDISELINRENFVINIENLNLLIQEYNNKGKIDENFSKLLFKKTVDLLPHIQTLAYSERQNFLNFLENHQK